MSLDPRLREALRSDAAGVQPDVERSLDTVRRRSSRRAPIHPVAFVALAAVVLAIVAIRVAETAPTGLGPGATAPAATAIATVGPTSPASPPAKVAYPEIAGTYSVTLSAADPGVTAGGLAGAWTLTLQLDGVIDLKPPATFRAEGVAPTGNAFTQAGTQFRTNLFYNDFCSSIGTYQWNRAAGRLTLTVVDDPCTVRSTLLATMPWREAAVPPSGGPPSSTASPS